MRLAFVAATGGAGATRLGVEAGAMLARDGRDAAVIDAAYATQGLADHLDGRLDPDVTALTLGDEPLEAGLVDVPVDAPGRLAACPARAPFERIARAKTADAARRLEDRIEEAAERFDHVLLDVPPVAANQAVAAVNAADRIAVVVPASARGADALARTRDRLTDLGASPDVTVLNRADDGDAGVDADAAVPVSAVTAPADAPVAASADDPFAAGVADLLRSAGIDLGVEIDRGGFTSRLFG